MKILYVIPSLNIGGAEVLLVKMSILLKNMGHKIAILVFKKYSNHLTDLLHANGIELVEVPNKRYFVRGVYSILNVIFVANYIKNHSFDIIHTHLTPAQVCLALVRFIYHNKTPLITTEHNTYNRRRKFYFHPFDFFLYSQFDMVVAISQAVKDALERWVPNIGKKCLIIYNGIDLGDFNGGKNHIHFKKQDIPVVISVGRLVPQKGYDILLQAFAFTREMDLYLVGDGGLRKEMENLVKELGLENRVHFLGNRNDIPQLLASSDIYVQSSIWEGFGIATLEAMATGLPVIVSNVSGLADIVDDAGLKFPSRGIKQLAECLTILAADKKLRVELSEKAKKRSKLFALEKTVREYEELYNEVVVKYKTH